MRGRFAWTDFVAPGKKCVRGRGREGDCADNEE